MKIIKTHWELKVFQKAFDASMQIFEISKSFPKEEKYSLTDQIRRSSRSVAANLAEAFRKRKYPKYFVAKIVDCESEAAETQVWLKFSDKCEYVKEEETNILIKEYDEILAMLVKMRNQPDKWSI
jgi:four helix bundle protein